MGDKIDYNYVTTEHCLYEKNKSQESEIVEGEAYNHSIKQVFKAGIPIHLSLIHI